VAFQQVAILGLGLIGASLGLALKRDPSAPQVVGFDIRSESLRGAARSGAIDRSCGTLPEVCRDSDVVVLATPVRSILELIPEIAPHLEEGTLLTDTGGTKAQIVRVAESALPPTVGFVGGHPLTGRLTVGVEQASASLFPGARYCLTPSGNTPGWAVERAVELVERAGSQPMFLDPEEHDALLAAASHLPYFSSVALFGAVSSQDSWPDVAELAAGGFRAASALVDADPEMWGDVASTNKENIVRQLDNLMARLAHIRDAVEAGDGSALEELQAARDRHRAWLSGHAGPPKPTADVTTLSDERRGPRWLDRLRRG
jgi:prephenate dehydrogenase